MAVKPESEKEVVTLREKVTGLERSLKNFKRKSRFFELLIRSLPGVFYLTDHSLNFQNWNKNLEKMTGYSPEELKDTTIYDVFSGEGLRKGQQRPFLLAFLLSLTWGRILDPIARFIERATPQERVWPSCLPAIPFSVALSLKADDHVVLPGPMQTEQNQCAERQGKRKEQELRCPVSGEHGLCPRSNMLPTKMNFMVHDFQHTADRLHDCSLLQTGLPSTDSELRKGVEKVRDNGVSYPTLSES